jgi:hypothetical protein
MSETTRSKWKAWSQLDTDAQDAIIASIEKWARQGGRREVPYTTLLWSYDWEDAEWVSKRSSVSDQVDERLKSLQALIETRNHQLARVEKKIADLVEENEKLRAVNKSNDEKLDFLLKKNVALRDRNTELTHENRAVLDCNYTQGARIRELEEQLKTAEMNLKVQIDQVRHLSKQLEASKVPANGYLWLSPVKSMEDLPPAAENKGAVAYDVYSGPGESYVFRSDGIRWERVSSDVLLASQPCTAMPDRREFILATASRLLIKSGLLSYENTEDQRTEVAKECLRMAAFLYDASESR